MPQNDETDIEKKRREADALLQSMGITSEPSVGMYVDLIHEVCVSLLKVHTSELLQVCFSLLRLVESVFNLRYNGD